jgi:hypothetical protein
MRYETGVTKGHTTYEVFADVTHISLPLSIENTSWSRIIYSFLTGFGLAQSIYYYIIIIIIIIISFLLIKLN